MKVRMLKTMTYYPDGIHETQCLQGEKCDLPEVVALSWLKQGFAEEDKVLDVPEETKQKSKPRKK
mgnify:CR=1 FL=1